MRTNKLLALKRFVIKYVSGIINGTVSVSDRQEMQNFDTKEDLVSLVEQLIAQGYAFSSDSAGWPPAAILEELQNEGLLRKRFTAIVWRGPEDFRTYVVDSANKAKHKG